MAATTGFAGFLTRVRHTLAPDDRTDAELVREYLHSRSDAAFAELVRRFAPMVWGVCRRTVGHVQSAEDAFQAVFLVLARKAATVRPPGAVGGWLHGVAVHTSMRARAMINRRRKAQSPLDTDHSAPSPPTTLGADELRALDEEIARLPDQLRAVVALCELDGVSRRDATKRLGVAEGTLSSRLATARKQLAARLRARGVTLGVGGIAALVANGTAAAVPPVVAASETVSALAEGAIRTMFLSKLKVLTAGVLAVALLITVGVTAVSSAASPGDRHARRNAPVPKAEKEGKILFWLDEKPVLLKPDGTELPSPDPIGKAGLGVGWGNAQLSPDGKRVAFLKQGEPLNVAPPKGIPAGAVFSNRRTTLHFLDLEGKKEAKSLDAVAAGDFHWLGDGSKLYVYGSEIGDGDVLSVKAEPMVYDVATGKRTPLKLPDQFHMKAFGPDGKTVILEEVKNSDAVWHRQVHLWAVGSDDKPTPLLDLNDSVNYPRISPDGKRLLCHTSHATFTPQGNGVWSVGDTKFSYVVVIDLASKRQAVIRDHGNEKEWRLGGLAWSPDGKKVAYVETKNVPRPRGALRDNNPFRLMVAGPDGKDAKEIYKAEGSWLVGFDWR